MIAGCFDDALVVILIDSKVSNRDVMEMESVWGWGGSCLNLMPSRLVETFSSNI